MWPTLRDADLVRRKNHRQVLVVNGLIFAGGGVLVLVMILGLSWDQAAREGWWSVLGAWQFWSLCSLATGMVATGVALHLWGRRTVVAPDPRYPTFEQLPAEDPRKARPLRFRRRVSALTGIGGLLGIAACVVGSVVVGPWLGQWPRFLLFFGGPLVVMLASHAVAVHYTGESGYPRR